jgi:cytochrome c-type biogenesis protein
MWVFLWFGLGFGLPLLIFSLLSGGLQRQLALLVAHHSQLINAISGLLLVAIAIYDLALNWSMLLLFFS